MKALSIIGAIALSGGLLVWMILQLINHLKNYGNLNEYNNLNNHNNEN